MRFQQSCLDSRAHGPSSLPFPSLRAGVGQATPCGKAEAKGLERPRGLHGPTRGWTNTGMCVLFFTEDPWWDEPGPHWTGRPWSDHELKHVPLGGAGCAHLSSAGNTHHVSLITEALGPGELISWRCLAGSAGAEPPQGR